MVMTPSDLPEWWSLSTETVDALVERTEHTEAFLRKKMAEAEEKSKAEVDVKPQAEDAKQDSASMESDSIASNDVDNWIASAPEGGYSDEQLSEICLDLHKKLYMAGYTFNIVDEVLRKVSTTRTVPFEITPQCITDYLKEDPELAVPPGPLTTSETLIVSNLFSSIMRQMRFSEANIVEVLGRISETRRAPSHISEAAITRFLEAPEITGQTCDTAAGDTPSEAPARNTVDFQLHMLSAFYRYSMRALGYPEETIEALTAKVKLTQSAPKKLDKASIIEFITGEVSGNIFEVKAKSESMEIMPQPMSDEQKFRYSTGNHAIGAGYVFSNRDVGKQPPIAFLMGALLAKTFANRDRLKKVTGDGAVTFITGVPLEYQSLAYETIFEGKLVTDCRTSSIRAGYARQIKIDGNLGTVEADGSFQPREQTVICIYGGDLKDMDTNTFETRRRGAHNDLRIGMHNNTYYALLAIVPDRSWLLPDLATPLYKDNTIALASTDRYVLAQAICGAFGIDRLEALKALEGIDESRLRQLNIEALAYALHKSEAQEAIAAVLELTKDDGKKVTMADIDGMGEAQKYANMVLRDLEAWTKGDLLWKDAVRSLLLYGEPGTGKTYMAQAMANTLPGVTFVSGSFGKWQSADKGHLGTFLKAMREDFEKAARSAPCVLFIDEIDSIGSRSESNSDGQNSSYKRWAINGFLECLNGPDLEGVIVVGACNDPDALDPAILRDGRLDLKAEVMLPGREAARKILETSLPEGFPIDEIIDFAIGQTPAAINGAVRKAKSEARMDQVELTPEMVRKKLVPFPGKRDEIAWRVAVHEAGHVVVANHFTPGSVKRAVIGQTGGGAAHMDYVPNEGLIEDLENRIAVMMAGRAAEEIFTGKVSAGAGGMLASDIAKATNMSIAIEARLGLGAEGLLYWDGKNHEWLDDAQARKRIQDRIIAGEQVARGVIEENKELLERIAIALKEKRVLDRKEINAFYE